jgi:RecQ family ATP-dependent DNA helicase
MNAEQWMGHIADLQAAHSSHVAGMIYGRGITEQPGTTAHRREMFRLSSTDWHRFLGFVSTDDGGAESALGLAQFSPWQKEAEIGRTERRWQLTQAAMEPEMQRMMGGNSELRLRGVQAPALEAIQQGQSPVVAVMPTGGGKSLLFMLPAWISPRGVTVVVVPLIALRGDMVHRCRLLGISCVEWESRRPADQASIVLVTPESAITEDFMTFLNRQRLCHRLDRIVIDECHVVLNDQTNFRPAMAQLGRLLVAQAQMIYLTATLPPTAENQLFQRLRTSREKVHLFRARTHRMNVAYRLWQPTVPNKYANSYDWVENPEIRRFIRDRITRARAQTGRVVIYGPTTKTVEKLAQLVECEAYHSRTIDRNGVLARFQADTTGVVAATSALGMGVDIPNIRSIIHIGLPRSLLDYAQESGRAGRDGLHSEAIIIQPHGFLRPKWDPIHTDPVKAQAEQCRLDRYISPDCCRRVILDEYLDSYQRQYCGESDDTEQRCDRCDEHWQANEAEVESELASELGSEGASEVARQLGSERNGPVPNTSFQMSDPMVLSHVLNQPADARTEQPMEGIQYSQGPPEVIQLTSDSEANSQRSESESVGFRSQVGSISPIYRRSIEPPGKRPPMV